MIPPIWFVELTRIEQANLKRRANASAEDPIENLLEIGESFGLNDDLLLSNAVTIILYNSNFFQLLN